MFDWMDYAADYHMPDDGDDELAAIIAHDASVNLFDVGDGEQRCGPCDEGEHIDCAAVEGDGECVCGWCYATGSQQKDGTPVAYYWYCEVHGKTGSLHQCSGTRQGWVSDDTDAMRRRYGAALEFLDWALTVVSKP